MSQGQVEAGVEPRPAADGALTDALREMFDGEHEGRIDAEILEDALARLLRAYPDAPVTALRDDGVSVPMPDSVGLKRNRVIEARSGLDLIVVDGPAIAGWDRMLRRGAAKWPVHPAGHPDITLTTYGLDLRALHGVIVTLSVFAAGESTDGSPPNLERPDVAPRFTTICKDQRSIIGKTDEAITRILGWSAEELQGRRSLELIHPDDQALAVDNWMQMLASPGPGRRVRLRHRRKDGSWVWFEVTNHNLLMDPEHKCVVSELVDISEEMAALELVDRLAEAVPVGLFQVDADRRIVYTNDRLHEILGVARADTAQEQLATVGDEHRPLLEQALDRALHEGLAADIEIELRLPPEGEVRFCTVGLRVLSSSDGAIGGAIACVADITDSARMRDELQRRATRDELTGCHNRASIVRALEAHVACGERAAERAVVFVDVDRFKAVNDRYGHAAGDELLSIVAERLQSAVREDDMVGRIGGDEFLVLCPDVDGPAEALRLAERLAQAQAEEVHLAKGRVSVRLSIGVAWSSGEDADADELVAQADHAMYESKREGAGRAKLADLCPAP
jgi:diguanylate cyclase (GGDEF)-like protein/PAS domain S-box-containing protein